MISPSEITANIVTLLRAIPTLLPAMGNDEERIYVYDDTYPVAVNRTNAILTAPSPSIMVMHRGVRELSAGWKFSHRISMFVRPMAGETYSNLIYLIISGVPAGQTLGFPNCEVHPGLDLMRIEGEITPVVDEEGVEFLEFPLTLDER